LYGGAGRKKGGAGKSAPTGNHDSSQQKGHIEKPTVTKIKN